MKIRTQPHRPSPSRLPTHPLDLCIPTANHPSPKILSLKAFCPNPSILGVHSGAISEAVGTSIKKSIEGLLEGSIEARKRLLGLPSRILPAALPLACRNARQPRAGVQKCTPKNPAGPKNRRAEMHASWRAKMHAF